MASLDPDSDYDRQGPDASWLGSAVAFFTVMLMAAAILLL
jgi:hypothetical protein